MLAAKQPDKGAERHGTLLRRPKAWMLGVVIGAVAGLAMTLVYPAPSRDVIEIQAANWYENMRELLAPTDRGVGNHAVTEATQVHAVPPIGLPPEAQSHDNLNAENMAELVNVNAPQVDAEQLSAKLDAAIADAGYVNRVSVADVATGETLYDNGGDDAIVPASTLKLYTAVSALEHLDADHQFVTSANYDPAEGVVLVGGGDGLLSTGESTGETMGYAGLADLAQETWDAIGGQYSAGDDTTIDVRADVSRYEQPTVHPSWNDGLMTAGWASPVYSMNTFGGFFSNPLHDNTAVDDGANYAGGVFAQHLTGLAQADGLDIDFRYEGQQTESADGEPVAEIRSAPFGQQLEYAMKQSNNMLLEMFGREAAIAAGNTPDFEGSTATTMSTVNELGVSTEHLQFVDNSGLSPDNRATLNSMTQLYNVIVANEQLRPILHSLTIAGYDGTMRDRLAEAPYSGVVRSKTGTLEVASSNAGMTVTADGRTLWFAVNTAGSDQDYDGARAEQDRLTEIITECGCSGE